MKVQQKRSDGSRINRTQSLRDSSYPWPILSLLLLNHGFSLLAILSCVAAMLNLKRAQWYKSLWPWLLLIPLAAGTVMNFLTAGIAKKYDDPQVPIETSQGSVRNGEPQCSSQKTCPSAVTSTATHFALQPNGSLKRNPT